MAVASSTSPSKQNHPSQQPNNTTNNKKNSRKQPDGVPSSPRKRNKCPGVRVVGARIYDSQNGKSCHQCRQKTMDFAAACKRQKNGVTCTIKFCHKCLLNRYGENAEEVATLEDWSCPRCRGICNCSFCMKKRGHKPTGILVHTAKATGFSSVSAMLLVDNSRKFDNDKIVEHMVSSPKKEAASEKESMITSPRKWGKENSSDLKMDSNLHSMPFPIEQKLKKMKRKGTKEMHDDNGITVALTKETSSHSNKKKPKKMKQEGLKEMHGENGEDGALSTKAIPHSVEKKSKKMKHEELNYGNRDGVASKKESSPIKPLLCNGISKEVKTKGKIDGFLQNRNDLKAKVSKEVNPDPFRNEKERQKGGDTRENDEGMFESENNVNGARPKIALELCQVNRNDLKSQKDLDANILLPQGTALTTVVGLDLMAEDVGNALQFLEFCAVFGKVLNVKKGQPASILRELLNGRRLLRGQSSTVVQFHIQLLSVILKESGEKSPSLSPMHGKNSWLHALRKCISESQCVFSSIPLDCLDRGADGYYTLDSSKKLIILNFVCDEVLGTAKIRNWIDDQNSKFVEKEKEAKEKLFAARDKEKHLRQKMKDEIAEAIIAKNGAPLSISEHEAIVSQIKFQAAKAHAETLQAKGMVHKNNQIPDAVRTVPILLDINGQVYWRLKGYSDNSDILLQELKRGDSIALDESWFTFDVEQEKEIEKVIDSRNKV